MSTTKTVVPAEPHTGVVKLQVCGCHDCRAGVPRMATGAVETRRGLVSIGVACPAGGAFVAATPDQARAFARAVLAAADEADSHGPAYHAPSGVN